MDPTTAAAAPDLWTVLLPVLVGGGIGLIGGVAGPPISHLLSRGAAAKDVRLQRLERLLSVLYEHEHWLKLAMHIRVFGSKEVEGPEPLPEAMAIVSLHFPSFEDDAIELRKLSGEYEIWMLEAAQKRLKDNDAPKPEGASDVHNPFYKKLIELRASLAEYGRTNLVK